MLQTAQKVLPENMTKIGLDDFLPESGLDSLTTFDLMTALEEKCKHPLPQALFFEHPTLRSAASRILSDLGLDFVGEEIQTPQEEPFAFRPKHRGMLPGKTRIGIVGAGVGGLVSALELARLGYKDITIFEADSKCGGKVASAYEDGDVLELGQNVFIDSFRTVLQIATDLKCEIKPIPSNFLCWDEKYGFEAGPTRNHIEIG
jgi:acyl carrier protein